MVNPLGLAIATDTVSPFPTVMLEIARVLVVPETLNAPLVAPVTVMLSAVKVVGSTLKVSVKPVEFAVPDVPPVCTALSKVTSSRVSLYTTTALGEPFIVNPLGLLISINTKEQFANVISDIARLLVVPLPLNAPFVAPVTVMLFAVNEVGSTLNVKVKPVESATPSVP